METTTQSPGRAADAISARMERLPMSRWHIKARVIVGAVTFFDGFDQLMIAYSIPDLPTAWNLSSTMIAWIIAVGGIGMLVGALGGGWLADRVGRLNTIQIALVVYAITSLGMAFTHSLALFMILRFVQGVGLGAEVPVAAAYIGEISKAHKRGRFVLLYETIFPVGLVMSAIVSSWIVPRWGYEVLFALGAIPILLVPMLRRVPESPRWLAAHGRLDKAEESMARIESEVAGYGLELPEPRPTTDDLVVLASPRVVELFRGVYLKRTLMLAGIWLSAYFVNYGIASWLPTLYKKQFGVSTATALHYSIFTTVAGLVGCLLIALLIDNLGRKICISVAMAMCTVVLALLAAIGTNTELAVLGWSAAAALLVFAVNMALYVYTAELYPTRMRAMGSAVGGAAGRLGIVVGPLVVGFTLDHTGSLSWVFAIFAVVAGLGAIIVALFATETKEMTLEEISR
ncbi:MFS transporter [Gordonia humi]|uniref:Putative MFS transporter n=1 Tax=Gordonia humi TaxID=686429 RepID=A0A840EVD2_9ACTN|nr:MFS transporter [Gordonia humi]MBB4134283.1 putative MFS transporter [Gordonia humi]